MNSDFPRIITLQRKERKISQKQAAADLGISQALLSHYEKGIRECGLEFLVRIADYYNVSCDYLLGRVPAPNAHTPKSSSSDINAEKSEEIISDSVSILFSLASKSGSPVLEKDISSAIMIEVYKIFRMLYNANSGNDQKLFRITQKLSENYTDAFNALASAKIKSESEASADSLAITTTALSGEYSAGAASLLNLIRLSEDYISEVCP